MQSLFDYSARPQYSAPSSDAPEPRTLPPPEPSSSSYSATPPPAPAPAPGGLNLGLTSPSYFSRGLVAGGSGGAFGGDEDAEIARDDFSAAAALLQPRSIPPGPAGAEPVEAVSDYAYAVFPAGGDLAALAGSSGGGGGTSVSTRRGSEYDVDFVRGTGPPVSLPRPPSSNSLAPSTSGSSFVAPPSRPPGSPTNSVRSAGTSVVAPPSRPPGAPPSSSRGGSVAGSVAGSVVGGSAASRPSPLVFSLGKKAVEKKAAENGGKAAENGGKAAEYGGIAVRADVLPALSLAPPTQPLPPPLPPTLHVAALAPPKKPQAAYSVTVPIAPAPRASLVLPSFISLADAGAGVGAGGQHAPPPHHAPQSAQDSAAGVRAAATAAVVCAFGGDFYALPKQQGGGGGVFLPHLTPLCSPHFKGGSLRRASSLRMGLTTTISTRLTAHTTLPRGPLSRRRTVSGNKAARVARRSPCGDSQLSRVDRHVRRGSCERHFSVYPSSPRPMPQALSNALDFSLLV